MKAVGEPAIRKEERMTANQEYIDIVFDGPPAHESGRFVEVEDPSGASVRVGEWIDRGDGYWVLRIQKEASADAIRDAKREAWAEADSAHYPLVLAVEQFKDNGGDAWGNLDSALERVQSARNPYTKGGKK